jgi:hypothetical protein
MEMLQMMPSGHFGARLACAQDFTDTSVNSVGWFVSRSRVLSLGLALSLSGAFAAEAGPCMTQITEVERQIRRAATGPVSGPTATQSIGAQLHHQPTPGSVQGAEAKAQADAEAALDRARRADSVGDAAACAEALKQAKEVYGLD